MKAPRFKPRGLKPLGLTSVGVISVLILAIIGCSEFTSRVGPEDSSGEGETSGSESTSEQEATEVATEEAQEAAPQVSLVALRESAPPVPWWQRLMSFFGLFAMVGIAWLFSSHKRKVPWRIVGWGMALQLVFGVFVLKTEPGAWFFGTLNKAVVGAIGLLKESTGFLFAGNFWIATLIIVTIIFFSSLMAVLYHLGVMQRLVSGLAWVMQRTMGTSGSETLAAAANVFVGQTEAPLVVGPFIKSMTRSELNAMMVGGFATIAGAVLAAYVGMLEGLFPDIAGHLVAASVMSAPAALVIAKVMLPETEVSPTKDGATLSFEKSDANVIDAAARGAGEGTKLALNVVGMLIAFLGLVAVLNYFIGAPVELYNYFAGASFEAWTMQGILSWVFWPIAFLMGVAPEDCGFVAELLGEKMVLNEFIAYDHLAKELAAGREIQYRSLVIITYALCGFSNFSSIAIQIGGIGGIAPERRGELAKLGLRAMFGGMLAACMTATVAGMLV